MDKLPPLSIVMPCLNEESSIRSAVLDSLQAFDQNDITGEVIVVNDGSNDGSQSIVEQMISTDSRIKILNKKMEDILDTNKNTSKNYKHI